jgi:hypothetical protein
LGQHRIQQSGTDLLAAIFDRGSSATEIKGGVRTLAARVVENDGNATGSAKPLDAVNELAAFISLYRTILS